MLCREARLLALSALCCLSVAAQTPRSDDPAAVGQASLNAIQARLEALAKETYPAVVTVTSHRRAKPTSIFDLSAQRPEMSKAEWVRQSLSSEYPGHEKIRSGSGFVVSEDGEILTCRDFVVDEDGSIASIVSVETWDLRHTICDVVATEPTINIALIKLRVFSEMDPPLFETLEFGNSILTQAGHWSLVAGNPAGPERFFTTATVTSPPSRDCYQDSLTATYLQAAMTAHPEAYGGPMLNLSGEVIGILVPKAATVDSPLALPNVGLEYAMPSNIVQGIYRALRIAKSTKSPWLGFAVTSKTELRKELGADAFNEMSKPRFGIRIENTFRPSPAVDAGVRPGDWLVRFDGEFVYTPLVFQRYLYLAGIGAEVELEFFRDGETFVRTVKVAERPAEATNR